MATISTQTLTVRIIQGIYRQTNIHKCEPQQFSDFFSISQTVTIKRMIIKSNINSSVSCKNFPILSPYMLNMMTVRTLILMLLVTKMFLVTKKFFQNKQTNIQKRKHWQFLQFSSYLTDESNKTEIHKFKYWRPYVLQSNFFRLQYFQFISIFNTWQQ